MTALGLLMIGAPIAAAQGEAGPVGQPSSPASLDGGMGWGALRLFAGLGIVIAVIAAIAWFMRRRQGLPAPKARGALPGVEIVGMIPLAPNRSLHALRMADEVVLIAVSEGGASVIARRSGEEAEALIGRGSHSPPDPLAAQIESSLRRGRVGSGIGSRLRRMTVRP